MRAKIINILSSFATTDTVDMKHGIPIIIICVLTLVGGVLLQMHLEAKNKRKTARAK